MQYRKKQKNNLIIIAVIILLLASIVVGQQKENKGYLFGRVAIDDPKKEYSIPLPFVTIELLHKNKNIKIITNEMGLIDEMLPKGKFQLLSVKTKEGVLFEFVSDQKKSFEIKAKKQEQFNITLKPQS